MSTASTSPLLSLPVLDARGRPLDVVELRGMRVDCIVGVYRSERDEPQPLDVEVALYLDTRTAASGGQLRDTINYARLSGELRFLLESSSFLLLETAADALCRYILAPPTEDGGRVQVEAVTVRLSKPEALTGGAVASLQVHRRAGEYVYGVEDKPFVRVDVLYEDKSLGIYRLRIKPGGTIVTHEHRQMDECELVLGSGLLLQGHPIRAGTGLRWPRHFPHRYDNPQSREQTILCVDRPAFIPEDEIPVEPPAEGLLPVQGTPYYPAAEDEHRS
ncbi:MAG: dihydroneopterin aldolase [Myxococcaceae bacterium]